ncbi:hypothetical protein [Paenibacillus apiarius]|uniref:hypothetical protein n=1 Tax=Paenibacillus apiarius TaxID=46240 RepID=UPI00197F0868|nr:hypothetical protein [Paenibacillus apiarius]MBN3524935.1 hypothetical protein [Paenibacillus apiarius]
MRNITKAYITLAVILAINVFIQFFVGDKLMKDIALSCAIIYFFVLVFILKLKDDRKQKDGVAKVTKVHIAHVVILGINFFIQIFSGDNTIKDISMACTFFYFTIFAIIYLVKRK